MTWYAIRLKPMALRVDRGSNQFRILREMWESGFDCYVPAERKTVIHHRTKEPISKLFPLTPGYAFVQDPHSWFALHSIKHVASVLGIGGQPMVIREDEVDRIIDAEAAINRQNAERDMAIRASASRPTRRGLAAAYPVGSRITVNHAVAGRREIEVTGHTGRRTVQGMMEFLGGLVAVEVDVNEIGE